MDQIITLLERKNLCYKSFYRLCVDFIEEIAKGETTNLEKFQKRRGGLIRVLEQLELEVKQLLASYDCNPEALNDLATDAMKARLNLLLKEKDSIVKSILDIDLQILAHIDRIKDDTIQRLQSLQSGKRTIGAYKSPVERIESAENRKIMDREA